MVFLASFSRPVASFSVAIDAIEYLELALVGVLEFVDQRCGKCLEQAFGQGRIRASAAQTRMHRVDQHGKRLQIALTRASRQFLATIRQRCRIHSATHEIFPALDQVAQALQ